MIETTRLQVCLQLFRRLLGINNIAWTIAIAHATALAGRRVKKSQAQTWRYNYRENHVQTAAAQPVIYVSTPNKTYFEGQAPNPQRLSNPGKFR